VVDGIGMDSDGRAAAWYAARAARFRAAERRAKRVRAFQCAAGRIRCRDRGARLA